VLITQSASDQCILKATFIPNKGAKDSIVFVGPGSLAEQSPRFDQDSCFWQGVFVMRLYDLSGRCVDKMSVRKCGVYISTYGQGILEKKVMFSD